MKRLIFITLLSIHCINIQTSESPSINHNAAKNLLIEDYRQYLRNQLENYKKQPVYFNVLVEMGNAIIGGNRKCLIRDTRNDAGETFLHIAVDKEDLSFIKESFTYFSTMHYNNKGKYPLDKAIEKILPATNISRTDHHIAILETIALKIAHTTYEQKRKEDCLKKIIALELECKAYPSTVFSFVPSKKLLEKLTSETYGNNSEDYLANVYKKAIEPKTGNTFAHVCVQQENPDELFTLVVDNRISSIQNKEGLDPLQFALRAFRKFTSAASIDTNAEAFKRTRCCYLILYHYFSKSLGSCCDKHKMPADK